MSAIQIGALCFLLLSARAWPAAGNVPLTALLWRSAACAITALLVTITSIAFVLQPLALLPLQWLAGAAAAGAAATLAVRGTRRHGASIDGMGDATEGTRRSPALPDATWPILVGAGLLPLLAAVPDPFALGVAPPRAGDMLVHGGRAALAMLVVLAAFGGLCNRAAAEAGTEPAAAGAQGGMRLATVAVLALPIIGFAPWLGGP